MKKILDKLHKTEKIHTEICFFTHSKKFVGIYQIARVTQKIIRERKYNMEIII